MPSRHLEQRWLPTDGVSARGAWGVVEDNRFYALSYDPFDAARTMESSSRFMYDRGFLADPSWRHRSPPGTNEQEWLAANELREHIR